MNDELSGIGRAVLLERLSVARERIAELETQRDAIVKVRDEYAEQLKVCRAEYVALQRKVMMLTAELARRPEDPDGPVSDISTRI